MEDTASTPFYMDTCTTFSKPELHVHINCTCIYTVFYTTGATENLIFSNSNEKEKEKEGRELQDPMERTPYTASVHTAFEQHVHVHRGVRTVKHHITHTAGKILHTAVSPLTVSTASNMGVMQSFSRLT